MNIHVSRPVASSTQQTAGGLCRRRSTVADIIRMQDSGIIDRRERFEWIDGEIVPMDRKARRTRPSRTNWSSFGAYAPPLVLHHIDLAVLAALPALTARLADLGLELLTGC